MEALSSPDGKPVLKIVLDKNRVQTTGRDLLADLILRLQIYKSTADAAQGIQYMHGLTKVDGDYEECGRWRSHDASNSVPPTLRRRPETCPSLCGYSTTCHGFTRTRLVSAA